MFGLDVRKSSLYKALYRKAIQRRLERIPFMRRIYGGWGRTHPIDVHYGIDTSGFVPVELLHPDRALTRQIIPYAGSQPGIVRRALAALSDPLHYSFIDLGCGKGRATIVASEFPFRQIIGVELCTDLVRIAQANSETIKRRFPDRSPITIVGGNALQFTFPPGKLVIFMYHPFGRELMAELVKTLESKLVSLMEHVFIVYNNPVHGDLLDASPALMRWFADTLPYDESEVGFGPGLEETVVIWQSLRGAYPQPHPGAQRRIIITKEAWTAELAN